MKTIIWLLIIPTFVFASDYIPMLGETNEWYIYRDNGFYRWTEKYSIENKVYNINDNQYKLIKSDQETNPICYVREDSTNQKVFAIFEEHMKEFILYDFLLNIGDTFNITTMSSINTQENHGAFKVVDKDSILIGKKYFRKITLHSIEGLQKKAIWVEGIGSTYEPLNPLYYVQSGSWLGILLCYYKNGIKEYSLDSYQEFDPIIDCNITVGIDDYKTNTLKAYPNPFQNTLSLENTGIPNGTIIIYNTVGQVVFQKPLKGTEKQEVDLSHLPKGLYIVKVFNGHKSYSEIVLKE